jgi:hypothetical protein
MSASQRQQSKKARMLQLLRMLEDKMQPRARPESSVESAAVVTPSVLQNAAAPIAIPSDVPMETVADIVPTATSAGVVLDAPTVASASISANVPAEVDELQHKLLRPIFFFCALMKSLRGADVLPLMEDEIATTAALESKPKLAKWVAQWKSSSATTDAQPSAIQSILRREQNELLLSMLTTELRAAIRH